MIPMTASEIDNLLTKLCVELGFCLPPSALLRLQNSPPADIDSFTDAVFAAEGLDPQFVNRRLRAEVREMIRAEFARASIQTRE
jgi:hypothetical protein